jgi:hypothetical protein
VENGLINVENVENPLREDLVLQNIREFTLENGLIIVENPLWK